MANSFLLESHGNYTKNLPFEIIAEPQNRILQSNPSNPILRIPVTIKLRTRNTNNAERQSEIISIPKLTTSYGPKKLRLVKSDQTIMSFDLLMEKHAIKKTPKKSQNKFFQIFGSGCLSPNNDDDESAYTPSSSYKVQKVNNTTSNSSIEYEKRPEKMLLKKHLTISSTDTDTLKPPKTFLGKCKPGGCLDPPFSEDKYSYTPKTKPVIITDSIIIEDLVAVDKPKNTTMQELDVPILQQVKLNKKLSSLPNEKLTKENSSHSLITYPHTLSPSKSQSRKENFHKKIKDKKTSENAPSISMNEFSSEEYFMPRNNGKNKNRIASDEISIPKNQEIKTTISHQKALGIPNKFEEKNNLSTNLTTDKTLQNMLIDGMMPLRQIFAENDKTKTRSGENLTINTDIIKAESKSSLCDINLLENMPSVQLTCLNQDININSSLNDSQITSYKEFETKILNDAMKPVKDNINNHLSDKSSPIKKSSKISDDSQFSTYDTSHYLEKEVENTIETNIVYKNILRTIDAEQDNISVNTILSDELRKSVQHSIKDNLRATSSVPVMQDDMLLNTSYIEKIKQENLSDRSNIIDETILHRREPEHVKNPNKVIAMNEHDETYNDQIKLTNTFDNKEIYIQQSKSNFDNLTNIDSDFKNKMITKQNEILDQSVVYSKSDLTISASFVKTKDEPNVLKSHLIETSILNTVKDKNYINHQETKSKNSSYTTQSMMSLDKSSSKANNEKRELKLKDEPYNMTNLVSTSKDMNKVFSNIKDENYVSHENSKLEISSSQSLVTSKRGDIYSTHGSNNEQNKVAYNLQEKITYPTETTDINDSDNFKTDGKSKLLCNSEDLDFNHSESQSGKKYLAPTSDTSLIRKEIHSPRNIQKKNEDILHQKFKNVDETERQSTDGIHFISKKLKHEKSSKVDLDVPKEKGKTTHEEGLKKQGMLKNNETNIEAALSKSKSDLFKNVEDSSQEEFRLSRTSLSRKKVEQKIIDKSKDSIQQLKPNNSLVMLNFGFHTVKNNKNELLVKTFDVEMPPKQNKYNKITVFESAIKPNRCETIIPITSSIDITLYLKKSKDEQKQNNGAPSGTTVDKLEKNIEEKTSISEDKCYQILDSVYENLISIEKAMKLLKDEADLLSSQQSILKEILMTRDIKPMRVIHSEIRNCNCLKKSM